MGSTGAEKEPRAYPTRLRAELGGYYRLGGIFVKPIGHPEVMKICTKYGFPRKTLMVHPQLSANLTDSNEEDAMDKVINSLSKVAPSA